MSYKADTGKDVAFSQTLNIGPSANILVGSPTSALAGWEDMIGLVQVKGSGLNNPAWNVYRTNTGSPTISLSQWQTSAVAMTEIWFEFHIPHGYTPGTDLYLHTHWSCNATGTGNVQWFYDISYAKGHQQAVFNAPIRTSVVQSIGASAYEHMIAETIMTDNTGAALINKNLIEVDGLILVRMWRDPGETLDTITEAPFVHFCDIHFQKSRFSTLNKAPNFYA